MEFDRKCGDKTAGPACNKYLQGFGDCLEKRYACPFQIIQGAAPNTERGKCSTDTTDKPNS